MPAFTWGVCFGERMVGLKVCRGSQFLSRVKDRRFACSYPAFFHAGSHRTRNFRQVLSRATQTEPRWVVRRKAIFPSPSPQTSLGFAGADSLKEHLVPAIATDLYRLELRVQRQVHWQLLYFYWRQNKQTLVSQSSVPWIPQWTLPRLDAPILRRPPSSNNSLQDVGPAGRRRPIPNARFERAEDNATNHSRVGSSFSSSAPQTTQTARYQAERRPRLRPRKSRQVPTLAAPTHFRVRRNSFALQSQDHSAIKESQENKESSGHSCKEAGSGGIAAGKAECSSFVRFEDHWEKDDVERAIQAGVAFRGVLHVSAVKTERAVVVVSTDSASESLVKKTQSVGKRLPESPHRSAVEVAGFCGRNRAMHGDTVVATLLARGVKLDEALQFLKNSKRAAPASAKETHAEQTKAFPWISSGTSQRKRRTGRRTNSPLQARCRVVFIEHRSKEADSLLAVMHPQIEKVVSFANANVETQPFVLKALDSAKLFPHNARPEGMQIADRRIDGECSIERAVGLLKAQPRDCRFPPFMVNIAALVGTCEQERKSAMEKSLLKSGEEDVLGRLVRLWSTGSSCLVLIQRGEWAVSEPAPSASGPLELLGEKGNVKAESDGALQQLGLQHRDFSPQVYRQLQRELSAKCPLSQQPLWLVEALEDPTRLDCRRASPSESEDKEACQLDTVDESRLAARQNLSFFAIPPSKDLCDVQRRKQKPRLPLRIFTIDPPDARDLDDALSISLFPLKDKPKPEVPSDDPSRSRSPLIDFEFEVGVHVADVSFFVKEGSLLDAEAMDRATSVYLDSRVYPMLPRELSEGVCSLLPQSPRLCRSVFCRVARDGSCRTHAETKSLICTDTRLSYCQVDAFLESVIARLDSTHSNLLRSAAECGDAQHASPLTSEQLLRVLIYGRRMQSADTESPACMQAEEQFEELRHIFAEVAESNSIPHRHSGRPVAIRLQRQSQSWAHSMVEEAMVLANFAVGTRILSKSAALSKEHLETASENPTPPDFPFAKDIISLAPRSRAAVEGEEEGALTKGKEPHLAFGGILRKHESSNEAACNRLLQLLPADMVEELLRGLKGASSSEAFAEGSSDESCSETEKRAIKEKKTFEQNGVTFGSLLELCSAKLPPHAFAGVCFSALRDLLPAAYIPSHSAVLGESKAQQRSDRNFLQLLPSSTDSALSPTFSAVKSTDGADVRHWGLALPVYLHFTSPIRRYADLLVHRCLQNEQDGFIRPLKDIEEMCARCNRNKRKAEDAQQNFRGWFFNEYLKSAYPEGIVYGYASVTHIHVPFEHMSKDGEQMEAAELREVDGDAELSKTDSTCKDVDVSGDSSTPTVPALQVFVPLLQQARSCSLATLGLEFVSVVDAEKHRAEARELQGVSPFPVATVRGIRVRRAKASVSLDPDTHPAKDNISARSLPSKSIIANCADVPLDEPCIQASKNQIHIVAAASGAQTLPEEEVAELRGSACSCSGIAEGEDFIVRLFESLRVRLLPGERQWMIRLCFD